MLKYITRGRIILLIIIVILLFAGIYIGKRLPIITGFAAKGMCSSVFVAKRDPHMIKQNDLNFFPISLAKTKIDYNKKYVTATLLGLAKQKAVYHEGCGCSLVSDNADYSLTHKELSSDINTDTINWPDGDRLTDTIPAGVQIDKLKQTVDNAFDNPGENIKQTAAVIVVYKGQLLAEKYAGGFNRKTRMLGWSMTKSVTNALVGILVKEGKLNINAKAPVKEWTMDKRSSITLSNLLHMNSGLEWTEDYFNLSDVTKMLYKSDDMYDYAVKAKYLYPAESKWFYSSGTANVVSGIVRSTFPDESTYLNFPYKSLFGPIKMRSMIMETDASGTFVGSSYSFATARDWARFGILYLNDGIWQGNRILPDGWVKYTTTVSKGSNGAYGAFFWLNKNKTLSDVPDDTYFCDGFKGQRIFIIPSKHLVIVRLGFSSKKFDFNRFVSTVIETLPAETR